MPIPFNRHESAGSGARIEPTATDLNRARSTTGSPRVMVYVRPDRFAAAELIAGASLSQELGAFCYAFFADAAGGTAIFDHGVGRLNKGLAQMLGAVVVNAADEETGQAVIAFAKKEDVTHTVFGEHVDSRGALSSASVVQGFSRAVRDVDVRVVRPGDLPQASAWDTWTNRDAILPILFLFAIFGHRHGGDRVRLLADRVCPNRHRRRDVVLAA